MTEATIDPAGAARIARAYIALWNETDPSRRASLLEEGWTADAVYVDPLMAGAGHGEISGLVGAVQARFPGFRFALDGTPDGHGDKVRFSWTLGPDAEPDMIRGTDFATVTGGRLGTVTGFLDKVPALA